MTVWATRADQVDLRGPNPPDLARRQQVFRSRVRTVLTSSYTNHYRRMLPKLLAALMFRCNNTAYRPVMDALDLLARYAGRDRARWYDPGEQVPLDGVVPAAWREAVYDERGRVLRVPYELGVLTALRDAIRRREIWVVGAGRWRAPACRTRHRGGHRTRAAALRAHRTGDTPLLPDGVDGGSPHRRHRAA